ncbi:CGNR zinc finger domain-containing protein [Streptomyces achromogenes]|uniref:CGNR zinc finger domain-containing protein n=1 Tax=Streptomyces achromogenes TaxID=67255 RepID=UPI00341B4F92
MAADDEWLWYGGRVCLDFVNTLRDRWKVPRETLLEPDDVARWLQGAGLLPTNRARTRKVPESALRSAVALREAIDRAVLGAAGGAPPALADITVINEASTAAPRPPLQLVLRNGELALSDAAQTAQDVSAGLGLVAQDAIELLLSPETRRVRICGAEHCALRFVDRSPAHNRRWCSMTRCGNRTKVRLHQARSRARG